MLKRNSNRSKIDSCTLLWGFTLTRKGKLSCYISLPLSCLFYGFWGWLLPTPWAVSSIFFWLLPSYRFCSIFLAGEARIEFAWNRATNREQSDDAMTKFRFLFLSLMVTGVAALVCTTVRRTGNMKTRRIDKDVTTWESEGGNLAPSAALDQLNSEATPDAFKRQ